MLDEATAEPLEGRGDHGQASLALLPVDREDADFGAALGVGTEQETVALVSLDHVVQFDREHVVASVLTLLLPRHRV